MSLVTCCNCTCRCTRSCLFPIDMVRSPPHLTKLDINNAHHLQGVRRTPGTMKACARENVAVGLGSGKSYGSGVEVPSSFREPWFKWHPCLSPFTFTIAVGAWTALASHAPSLLLPLSILLPCRRPRLLVSQALAGTKRNAQQPSHSLNSS